ncbi:MAG TPA: Na+/H+ antiporter [Nitrospirales bacterium]
MASLHQLEIVILLLVAVLALTTFARKVLIPYPILLVVGGLLLGMVPGLPVIRLDPDLVFLVFLPPILWAAAYFTSWRDFRANLRPITLLAVGLVLATTAAVALIAHALLPGLGWAGAIALGAIVSPPDAVAATAIARRLNLPHRVVTILEGESLVNDATALVLYRAAIAAAVSGTFVLSETLVQFVLAGTIGVIVGVAVGWVCRWALCLTNETSTDIGITFLAPYVAWVLAESLHASGVLACVAGGLYIRRYFSVIAPNTRLQARAVWGFVVFLFNAILFILIGLQLGGLRGAIQSYGLGTLIWHGTIVSAIAIGVRLAWVPVAAYLPRLLSPALRARDPMPPWSVIFLIGWTGMRGIVSLAAALALPFTTASGALFPFRDEIILLTFAVILSTLVLQGLTLSPLVRWLNIAPDQTLAREEAHAREQGASAALERLEQLATESWPIPEQVERLRTTYAQRAKRFAQPDAADPDCSPQAAEAYRRLRHEALTAERQRVIDLRDQDVISDDVLHRLEHELDVEALRMGVGEMRVGLKDDKVESS